MKKTRYILIIDILIMLGALLFTITSTVSTARAAEAVSPPERYSLAGNFGSSYSPGNEIQFIQLSAAALIDYDQVWPHHAPELLRFKVEGSAGIATTPHSRALLSINMLALYFIDPLVTATLRPYVEAGIGVIYNDYQVDGQGLRINFNPQLGIGSEISTTDGTTWFIACRLHHISNGGLDDNNLAINSLMLQMGRFF
ncbi:MAG: acyloxyacyl hydrolase [Thermodesulfobacteriota bacterium]|nr:acyloxyacyl hydrolase [Thermodesulfobacteriota bacterium]